MGTISKYVARNGEVSFQAKVRRKGYKSQSKSFVERKDAQKWVRAIEAAMDRGEQVEAARPGSTLTLADLLRQRAKDEDKRRGGYIERMHITKWLTKDEYRDWRSTPLDKLDVQSLVWFRDHETARGIAPSTVARLMTLVQSTINAARHDGAMVAEIKLKRPKNAPHRDRVLKPEEEVVLLSNANSTLRRAIVFALETACRQGEIARLQYADLDLAARVARLHVTKTGIPRDVPLSSRAIEAIGPTENRIGLVFGYPNSQTICHSFRWLCKKSKVRNLRFHDLRHTCLTRLAAKGLSTVVLQRVSGHKTLSQLQRYVNLRATDVAEMLG
ncbi:site-specific integrase [Paraburkholderia hospita]|uniref:Integrase family protein n=1 Tax=Paraburkholderia hospita TaxID=169430 RepID=A0AAN1JHH1_9BURK|nr:site-specific integrase [Paraburkholderia hospita]AUT74037.1 site-specific integrase [Paraburkholderia hospita]EIN02947.1 integrase family protein [Paraburkholderia hospita]OUL78693.1 integrase [Paraburkholderia hospita]OUL85898.1 integrase [Paraburkholderia hospita]SEH45536.1 Site-specific recombinase XerD [Paraburkholderia hospita]